MDEAGDKVVWCGSSMDDTDMPHELVKVMSVVFASAERTSRRDKFHMQNQHVLVQLALCSKRLLTLPVSPQTSNSPLAIHYFLGEGSFSVKM